MEKGKLINLWMAQGYIKGKDDGRDMETLGDEYFQNLVMRSLFQDVEVKGVHGVIIETFCKMHDLVHDFAQSLVKKECRNLEVGVGESITLDDSIGIPLRHLGVTFRLETRCLDSFYSLKRLRSLHISTPMVFHQFSVELNLRIIFDEFTSLRSLSLYCCGVKKIPSNINKLIHLRMLDLSLNCYLPELPDTLWELYNLQTLILDRCDSIKSMKGLERLINLRYTDSFGAPILFPKEMEKLSGLRKLGTVCVDVENEEAFSLKHLKNLNQIGGSLIIRWLKHCDRDVEDAKQAQMQDKKLITRLHLQLRGEETEGRAKEDEDLIEALSAPPHLEFLKIDNYMGLKPPSWMTFLTSLKAIHLYWWRNSEHLPALGKFRFLQDLKLLRFEVVKKVGDEFLGMGEMMLSSSSNVQLFPKLRTLEFASFRDWEEWNDSDGVEEILIMPNLNCLKLKRCRKLKALPKFILHKTALKVEIIDCDALKISTS